MKTGHFQPFVSRRVTAMVDMPLRREHEPWRGRRARWQGSSGI